MRLADVTSQPQEGQMDGRGLNQKAVWWYRTPLQAACCPCSEAHSLYISSLTKLNAWIYKTEPQDRRNSEAKPPTDHKKHYICLELVGKSSASCTGHYYVVVVVVVVVVAAAAANFQIPDLFSMINTNI